MPPILFRFPLHRLPITSLLAFWSDACFVREPWLCIKQDDLRAGLCSAKFLLIEINVGVLKMRIFGAGFGAGELWQWPPIIGKWLKNVLNGHARPATPVCATITSSWATFGLIVLLALSCGQVQLPCQN